MTPNTKPKSAAERQRDRRKRLRESGKTPIYVQGKDGLFDERIRIACAIKNLADKGELSQEFLTTLLDEIYKTTPIEDVVKRKYIVKTVEKYLKTGD